MQPSQTISQDIKSLADWVYDQFAATDPIEVQNILDKPYFFRYCVGETIETPDQVSRKVVDRQYEEYTFQPGETKILMGGAAYIFVCGIAPHYVLATKDADAMGDLQSLVDAAALSIIGKVGYSSTVQPLPNTAAPTRPTLPTQEPGTPTGHNPNVALDNNGNLPPQGPTTGPALPTEEENEDDDAFANIGSDDRFRVVPAGESEDGNAHFFVDGKEVDNAAYNEALNANTNA